MKKISAGCLVILAADVKDEPPATVSRMLNISMYQSYCLVFMHVYLAVMLDIRCRGGGYRATKLERGRQHHQRLQEEVYGMTKKIVNLVELNAP